jgi:DNA-binding MarR family transcriptional regulator
VTKERKLPFSSDRPEASTGFLLWQVTTLWQRAMTAALRPHGLTQVQFVLLAGLLWLTRDDDEVTQVALARHTRLDAMMTSQVIRGLERRRLVRRAAHSTDRRARRLTLTTRARTLVPAAIVAVETVDESFFARLGSHNTDFPPLLRALLR